jgi:hypothetical protein
MLERGMIGRTGAVGRTMRQGGRLLRNGSGENYVGLCLEAFQYDTYQAID